MADIIDFTIQKLTIIDGPKSERGTRLLATFNLGFPGVIVHGCVLVEKASGIVRAYTPIGKTPNGHSASTTFTSPGLARAVTRRAAGAYTGYTGRYVSDE